MALCSRFIIGNILLPGIRDTQAGFKGFQSKTGKELFNGLKTKGYLFDLEILLKAKRAGYSIEKVYVDWYDRAGSKVHVMHDT